MAANSRLDRSPALDDAEREDDATNASPRKSRRPLEFGVFAYAPAIFLAWLAWFVSGHGGGGDFSIFRRAGKAVLDGHSPYVHPTATLLAANDRFVYPTPFALPFVPFALAPERAGARLPRPLGGGRSCLAAAARRPRLALLRRLDPRHPGLRLAGSRVHRPLPPPVVRARLALQRPHGRRSAARAGGGRETLPLADARLAHRHPPLPCFRGISGHGRCDPRALGDCRFEWDAPLPADRPLAQRRAALEVVFGPEPVCRASRLALCERDRRSDGGCRGDLGYRAAPSPR